MNIKLVDIFLTLVLNLIHCAHSDSILPCNDTILEPCPGEHQICNTTSMLCVCAKGFVFVGGECDVPSAGDTSHHGATAAIVTVFTLVLIISGLVLVVRKYNLIELARQKINLRRNNDVMYEDVMIGNDDPPLSP